ncbi:hypothetical protein AB0K80_02175 [Streptomyces sp. NPDC052682]|uniref:hypothetical protein n=1 Tax=Streptomyces sp. NPDC052682 TaxID=3154954 RepID=UPI00342EE9B9
MRTKHCFVTGALALLAFTAAQAPASAASLNVSNGGATASYNTATGVLEVCDTAADGKRAVAQLSTGTPGESPVQVADTDGAGNACARATVRVSPGRTITLSVWVQVGAEGTPEDKVSRRIVLA